MTIAHEIFFTFDRVWRELVPLPQDRKPLTWSTVPYAFGYMVPFLFMGYLARRRDTHTIRLLLLPTILVAVIRGTYGYGGFNREHAFYTWLRGLAGLSTIAMTLDFAFTHEGRLKIGESSLTPINEPSPPLSPVSSESSTSSNIPPPESVAERSLPPWALDTLEVCSTLRGIGWKFGKDVYIPPETRPLQRDTFMRNSTISFIKNYLILDFCLVVFKSFPGIGTPLGGSIYLSGLPLFHRHTVALLLSIFSGFTLISGFNVLNGAATLVGVGLLHQSPTQWPPIIDNPWAADSLHDFWTRRWHQTLRRTFLVLGGFAGQCFAGQPGLILGAFLASGLFHEGGTYLLGRGVDHRVTLFFVLQGVGVLIEKMYKTWTGRRWGGVLGRVSTYFFVLGLGQLALDSWFRRGLAGGTILPSFASPSTLLILPILRSVVERVFQSS